MKVDLLTVLECWAIVTAPWWTAVLRGWLQKRLILAERPKDRGA